MNLELVCNDQQLAAPVLAAFCTSVSALLQFHLCNRELRIKCSPVASVYQLRRRSNTVALGVSSPPWFFSNMVILNNFHSAKHVEHKGMVDLVTETDKACEDLIFNQLKLTFPSHELIGEETSAENGTPVLTDAPTWVVDPLDGTTNFVHQFPFVCVSIGLVINKVPVVGVVYNPIMGELFTAVKGQGAHLNGQRIRASSQEKIGTAILATEVGTIRDKKTVDRTTNTINNLLFQVRSVRMSGSCAMNLCGVACGRLDMFYEIGFGGPWDVAGGALIVQEAGGHVFDPSGGDFDLMSRRIASSNAHLKQALIAGIAG